MGPRLRIVNPLRWEIDTSRGFRNIDCAILVWRRSLPTETAFTILRALRTTRDGICRCCREQRRLRT
jgi:hypothetical protein